MRSILFKGISHFTDLGCSYLEKKTTFTVIKNVVLLNFSSQYVIWVLNLTILDFFLFALNIFYRAILCIRIILSTYLEPSVFKAFVFILTAAL